MINFVPLLDPGGWFSVVVERLTYSLSKDLQLGGRGQFGNILKPNYSAGFGLNRSVDERLKIGCL